MKGRNPFFIRSVFVLTYTPKGKQNKSQSLFHQVCVRSSRTSRAGCVCSRNPFFIRSVFVLRFLAGMLGVSQVAIPFSSGLCSFKTPGSQRLRSSRSQSLFHQVCVRSEFYISYEDLAHRKSQSLFHQVCVRSEVAGETYCEPSVAIPFSSGLCSFCLGKRSLVGNI